MADAQAFAGADRDPGRWARSSGQAGCAAGQLAAADGSRTSAARPGQADHGGGPGGGAPADRSGQHRPERAADPCPGSRADDARGGRACLRPATDPARTRGAELGGDPGGQPAGEPGEWRLAHQTPDEPAADAELVDYGFHLFTEKSAGEDSVIYRAEDGYRLALAHPRRPLVPPLRRPLRPHRTRRLSPGARQLITV